jgi:hypothetical protein
MKNLSNKGITIPGGFRYFCEETKARIPAQGSMPSYVDFIYAVKLHYIANNLPIGLQWEQQIQDKLCVGLSGDWCEENGWPVAPEGGWGFVFESVVQGTHRLAQKMIQAKARRVPVELSSSRASICAGCSFNQPPPGCTTCNQTSIDNASNSVEGAASVNNPNLRACRVSALSLKAKINVPLDIIEEILIPEQKRTLPERCWILREKERKP